MTEDPKQSAPAKIVGRYAVFGAIARGGMATVHLGRMVGPVGFAKTVAIKRLHEHLASDPAFVSMLLDEARLVARIHHPNVVSTLDVVQSGGEVLLVLDYVSGESLASLLVAARKAAIVADLRVLGTIVVQVLHGLHAAHEATDESGTPLAIVHRDVSPQNILVGADGNARVLDFGVAKAAGRVQSTRDGQLKGKLSYMAPEQVRGEPIDRRTDVFSAGVILWELFAGQRMVRGGNEAEVLNKVVLAKFAPPSSVNPALGPELDAVVMKAIASDPNQRYATAREMAIALERTLGIASQVEIAEWVKLVAADALAIRQARVREMESASIPRPAAEVTAPAAWPGPSGTIEPVEPSGFGSSATRGTTTPPPRPARVGLFIVLAAMLTAVALGAVAALIPMARTSRQPASGIAPARADEAPAAPSSAVAPAAESVPASSAASSASAVAIDAAAPAPTAIRPKPIAPAAPPKKPPPKVDCDPPFFVKDGIKHVKPECM